MDSAASDVVSTTRHAGEFRGDSAGQAIARPTEITDKPWRPADWGGQQHVIGD
jgi:hypothetical protein